jgi:hypothetical protein
LGQGSRSKPYDDGGVLFAGGVGDGTGRHLPQGVGDLLDLPLDDRRSAQSIPVPTLESLYATLARRGGNSRIPLPALEPFCEAKREGKFAFYARGAR